MHVPSGTMMLPPEKEKERDMAMDMAGTVETTTFRNDVRNDWVDAVFGIDFFPCAARGRGPTRGDDTRHRVVDSDGDVADDDAIVGGTTPKIDLGARRGTGNAGIPWYVAHGAVLRRPHPSTTPPAPIPIPTSGSDPRTTAPRGVTVETTEEDGTNVDATTNNNNGNNSNNNVRLGMTISRIPLGLYVHSLNVNSEAYSCGVSPGSILVDINGRMGMLGERSDRGLERLWRYEGLFSGGGNGDDGSNHYDGNVDIDDGGGEDWVGCGVVGGIIPPPVASTGPRDDDGGGGDFVPVDDAVDATANDVGRSARPGALPPRASSFSSSGSADRRRPPQSKMSSSSSIVKTTTTKASSSSSSTDLRTRRPLLLRFYKSGRVYSTLLLSGRPLSGIRWAPCGNFGLVHSVRPGGVADAAGVRRGAIITGVDGVGLRTLDHAGIARTLRDRFGRGVSLVPRGLYLSRVFF